MAIGMVFATLVVGCCPAGPSVHVTPSEVEVVAGGSVEFTARVECLKNPIVTWSATCGAIGDPGRTITYTAPGEAGTCVVTATSVIRADLSASAQVTVTHGAGAVIWTRQFGTSSRDEARGVAVDGSGSSLVAGFTWGALEGVNVGGTDAFVRKFDAAGNVLWTRQFGSSANDDASSVAVDGSGNVVVAGSTGGSLEGEGAGSSDAFVRKFDAAGNVLWTRQFGTGQWDVAHGVAVDGLGDVVVVGQTLGALEGVNLGSEDAFVRKFDAAGNVLWTRQFGTSSEEFVAGVAVDGVASVVVVGSTRGSLEGVSAGGRDAFVRKYDAAGDVVWTRQFGTSSEEFASGVAVDGSGNVVVAGWTAGSLEGVSAGGRDAFVRKFDAAGNMLWTHQFGTSSEEFALGVAADGSGNVIVVGFTECDHDWCDAFVRKLDAVGSVAWTRQFGASNGHHSPYAVAVDGSGYVVVVGEAWGSLAGAPDGSWNAFVRKYAP